MIQTGYALVVDDMPANHAVVQGFLKPYGISVDCVQSGIEAIELIREQKTIYNVVFMDQMMPEMDGMETVRIIRQELGISSEYAKKIPIIALTGNEETEEFFLKSGFNAFLSKPVKSKDMKVIVNRFFPDKSLESNASSSPADSNPADGNPANKGPADNPNIAKLVEEGSKISGLDIKSALENINWDWETCLEVIKSFTASTPGLLDILKNTSQENLPKYCVTVHGIKSVAFSFGANSVGEKAKALEHGSAAGDIVFVRENNDEFLQITEKLLQDLAPLIEIFSTDKTKPKKEKPDKALIAKILEASENYNIRGLEEGIEALDEYSYIQDADLIPWLKDMSLDSDFTAIYERLSKMEK